ncbi:hypothetical protein D2E40_24990 [Mycobacteroides abscessus]|uniref:LppU/SCO3897 family protein n=1 Tax=Mycobacteroides abscessus TaxID=36809 RepID=UPI000E687AC0|nr:hypothetical protein [Mycobacteroides abscessus]RIQ92028.1 hypothetical protein D2E40_24990 [Mycobacteroides abscessus]
MNRASSTVIVGIAVSVLTLPGCQSAQPAEPPGPNYAKIPGQFPEPATTTTAGAEDAPVGSCVKITGKRTSAAMVLTKCESPDATHRIVQRVVEPKDCVRDVDRRYYRNTPAGEWTACLDLYWANPGCLSITDEVTRAVPCNDTTAPNRFRATNLVVGVSNGEMCKGYAHPVRRFTVCTEMQK